ncbi:MAG: hypothetical protein U1A78_41275 [Polyangia bacterium]
MQILSYSMRGHFWEQDGVEKKRSLALAAFRHQQLQSPQDGSAAPLGLGQVLTQEDSAPLQIPSPESVLEPLSLDPWVHDLMLRWAHGQISPTGPGPSEQG